MRFLIRLLITVCVIVFCTQIGRKLPTLAGLIVVMPLTSLIVLIWLYADNPGSFEQMSDFCWGALWGILPIALFYLVAFMCFRKHLSLWFVLCAGFTVWFAAAMVHQWLLGK
jgi:uncharacterized membrane protein (GlpM family)